MREIVYKPDTHQYFVDGIERASVNNMLKAEGIMPNFNFPAAEYKRQLGHFVHQAIKLYFYKTLDEKSLTGPVKDYYAGFQMFLKDYPIRPFEVEKSLFSEKWGFCGTPDCYDDILYDWKVSYALYDFYYLTMAGYSILFEEIQRRPPKEIWLVQLAANSYKIKKIEPDRNNFLALMISHQYKQKRGLYGKSNGANWRNGKTREPNSV